MDDNNQLIFSIVVEYLSQFIRTDPEVYFNCLICSKVMQEKIVAWKPIVTIFSELPEKDRLINPNPGIINNIMEIITGNTRTYMENVRCYCYLSNLTKIRNWKVFGFVTDAPIEILNKSTLRRRLFDTNNPKIPLKITEYETCRYIQIDELYASLLFLSVKENNCNHICQMNFARNSEIIIGRHPIFAEINLDVTHTTTHFWAINGNRYFVSLITELATLR